MILSHSFSILRSLWIHILRAGSKLAIYLKRSYCLYYDFYLLNYCLLSLILYYSKVFSLSLITDKALPTKIPLMSMEGYSPDLPKNNWTKKINVLKYIYYFLLIEKVICVDYRRLRKYEREVKSFLEFFIQR